MKKMFGVLIGVFFLMLAFGSSPALGDYPEGPVKFIIPYGPGGATDVIFRVITAKAGDYLGKPLVFINMPGAGATKGSRYVKEAKSDGYTLLGGHDIIATAYYSKLSDYSFSAFEAVCLLTSTPNTVAVHAEAPFNTMKEMFDYAQKNPAKLVWAYTPASTSYFFFKGILKAAGIKADLFREVSIEGTGEQMKDLLGKHIDVILSNVASGGEYVKEGKIKFLSIAYDKRIPQISNVPTLKESGIPYVFSTNRGVFAPKGTPRDRIETLARAFEKACASGDIMKKIEEMGSIIDYKGPKDFTLFVEELDAFYKEAMQ